MKRVLCTMLAATFWVALAVASPLTLVDFDRAVSHLETYFNDLARDALKTDVAVVSLSRQTRALIPFVVRDRRKQICCVNLQLFVLALMLF